MENIINSHFNNMELPTNKKLKCIILGASGAVGRELVTEICQSPKWAEVVVIVRRILPEWKQHIDSDVLENSEKWKFPGFHSLFCVLGSRVKIGKEAFIKVDYTYPQYGGKIVKENGIPHYSLLSSVGASESSWFLYAKTKGQTENSLKKFEFNALSIFRPGFITDRNNDKRFVETIGKYIPFMPKIPSKQLAAAMRIESELLAERKNLNNDKEVYTYTNAQIKSILK